MNARITAYKRDFATEKAQIVLDTAAKPGCKRLQAWRIISAQLRQSCVATLTPKSDRPTLDRPTRVSRRKALVFVIFKRIVQFLRRRPERSVDGEASDGDEKGSDRNAKNCCGFHR